MRVVLAAASLVGLLSACGEPHEAQDVFAAAADAPVYANAAEQIEAGRYLAAAANCISCHTREDGEPFAGGLAFETPFGTIYSSNITPDPKTGIGAWTVEDFRRAMWYGVRPDGAHLYPAFPYTSYTKLAAHEVDAIFAYLKTIAPVEEVPLENDLAFPFGWRALMAVWKALYFEPGRFTPDPQQSTEWNRGAFLVEGLAHCSACHTPRNLLGAEREDQRFAGGEYVDRHPDGEPRIWSTPNLTPSKTGIGSWSVEDIDSYLRTGVAPRAAVYGPMNEVFMNSTRHLRPEDTRAMAVYLKSLPAIEGREHEPPAAKEMQRMSITYDIHCGLCHQEDGRGSTRTGPPLDGSAIVLAPNPAALINTILFGPHRPDPAPRVTWENEMPEFNDKLSDEEVADIATYVRSAWGNRASAVKPGLVEPQR